MKPTPRTNDTGVVRRYFEAKPNKMFSEMQRASIRFVEYKESVPCALCTKQSRYHWTCIVRFKAADITKCIFELKMSRNWFAAGAPVCHDHPTQPDEAEFRRKCREAVKAQGDKP